MNGALFKRVIIVLGMHRSGTSTIARALKVIDVDLGSDLQAPNFDNPKGFWEDKTVIEINEELLNLNEVKYDQLSYKVISTDNFRSSSYLEIKAKKLILERIKNSSGVWGFKDPRTCLTLPFWLKVFREVNIDVSFVIAIRNPLSIAKSLESRNQITLEKTSILLAQHLIPALSNTSGYKRIIVDYDQLIEQPYQELLRIAHHLNLPAPSKINAKMKEFENDFLEDDLRHSKFSLEDLLGNTKVWKPLLEFYTCLFNIARDKESIESAAMFELIANLNSDFNLLEPLIRYTNYLEKFIEQQFLSIAKKECQIENFSIKLKNQDIQIKNQDIQIDVLSQSLIARDAQVNDILMSNSWRITRPFRFISRLLEKKYL